MDWLHVGIFLLGITFAFWSTYIKLADSQTRKKIYSDVGFMFLMYSGLVSLISLGFLYQMGEENVRVYLGIEGVIIVLAGSFIFTLILSVTRMTRTVFFIPISTLSLCFLIGILAFLAVTAQVDSGFGFYTSLAVFGIGVLALFCCKVSSLLGQYLRVFLYVLWGLAIYLGVLFPAFSNMCLTKSCYAAVSYWEIFGLGVLFVTLIWFAGFILYLLYGLTNWWDHKGDKENAKYEENVIFIERITATMKMPGHLMSMGVSCIFGFCLALLASFIQADSLTVLFWGLFISEIMVRTTPIFDRLSKVALPVSNK